MWMALFERTSTALSAPSLVHVNAEGLYRLGQCDTIIVNHAAYLKQDKSVEVAKCWIEGGETGQPWLSLLKRLKLSFERDNNTCIALAAVQHYLQDGELAPNESTEFEVKYGSRGLLAFISTNRVIAMGSISAFRTNGVAIPTLLEEETSPIADMISKYRTLCIATCILTEPYSQEGRDDYEDDKWKALLQNVTIVAAFALQQQLSASPIVTHRYLADNGLPGCTTGVCFYHGSDHFRERNGTRCGFKWVEGVSNRSGHDPTVIPPGQSTIVCDEAVREVCYKSDGIALVGVDENDLPLMRCAGVRIAVQDVSRSSVVEQSSIVLSNMSELPTLMKTSHSIHRLIREMDVSLIGFQLGLGVFLILGTIAVQKDVVMPVPHLVILGTTIRVWTLIAIVWTNPRSRVTDVQSSAKNKNDKTNPQIRRRFFVKVCAILSHTVLALTLALLLGNKLWDFMMRSDNSDNYSIVRPSSSAPLCGALFTLLGYFVYGIGFRSYSTVTPMGVFLSLVWLGIVIVVMEFEDVVGSQVLPSWGPWVSLSVLGMCVSGVGIKVADMIS
eukprot:PhF_6_TR599/c2_g3_i1/m.695